MPDPSTWYNYPTTPKHRQVVQYPDTAIKQKTTTVNESCGPKAMQKVKEEVEQELQRHTRVTGRRRYLYNVLPVPSDSKTKVFEELVKLGLYDEAKQRWTRVPTELALEKHLYQPLAEIANAIAAACDILGLERKIPGLRWAVHSERYLKATDSTSPLIRPDSLSYVGTDDATAQLAQLIVELKAELNKAAEKPKQAERNVLQVTYFPALPSFATVNIQTIQDAERKLRIQNHSISRS